MMMEELTLWIVTEVVTETDAVSGERDSTRDIGGSWDRVSENVTQVLRKRVPLSASLLKQEMNGLLKVLGNLFEEAQQYTCGLELDEVELSVDINSEGQISVIGSHASVGSRGAITLKFKRSPHGEG